MLIITLSVRCSLLCFRFKYAIRNGGRPEVDHKALLSLDLGAVYVLVLREHHGKIMVQTFIKYSAVFPILIGAFLQFHRLFTMTPSNKIHMFWLIPQYCLISIAEVMFAISGLEFSFTQVRIGGINNYESQEVLVELATCLVF